MLKKILKSSLVAIATIGLSFSSIHGVSAQDNVVGKCSITIDKTKHTSEKPAKASGACGKVAEGYYGAGLYHVDGYHTGIVVDGQKYLTTIMPGFYTYEVTVHTVGQVQSLKVPTVSLVGASDKKVTGVTESKVKVTVKSGKTTLGTATSDKNGRYSVTLKKTQKAGAKLTVTVTKGKEKKTKTIIVNYNAPKVNAVHSTSTKVTGTTEPKAKVTIKVGSKVKGTAIADKKGKFTVKISKQKAGTKLSITATKSGNSMIPTMIIVK